MLGPRVLGQCSADEFNGPGSPGPLDPPHLAGNGLTPDDNLVHGSPEWQLAPELKRADDEPLVDKNYGDSFEGTTLESVLAGLGVGRLVVAGAQTDQCIRSTIHGAFARGYDTILVKDAHTTSDLSEWGAPPPAAVIAHTNLYWEYQDAPGKKAGIVGTKDVDFAG